MGIFWFPQRWKTCAPRHYQAVLPPLHEWERERERDDNAFQCEGGRPTELYSCFTIPHACPCHRHTFVAHMGYTCPWHQGFALLYIVPEKGGRLFSLPKITRLLVLPTCIYTSSLAQGPPYILILYHSSCDCSITQLYSQPHPGSTSHRQSGTIDSRVWWYPVY